MLSLDLIQTVAFAGVVLFAGYGIRRGVPVLGRYNIPAPVVGGLLVAGVFSFAASRGVTLATFDTTLQAPLMIAFFTSVGFGASVALFVAFVLIERRAVEPLIPFELFRIRELRASTTIGIAVGMVMFGTLSFLPLFVQVVNQSSATNAGRSSPPTRNAPGA